MRKQLVLHDPEAGAYGDCLRTSIAFMLGKSMAEVPHFMDGGPDREVCDKRVDDFLAPMGLREIQWPMDAAAFTLKQVADWFEFCNPGAAFIATVRSNAPGDWTHAIVIRSGKVALDPATGRAGRCADYNPVDSGDGDDRAFWWITVLASRGAPQ